MSKSVPLLALDLTQLEFWRKKRGLPSYELSHLLGAVQRLIYILRGWQLHPDGGGLSVSERHDHLLIASGKGCRNGVLNLHLNELGSVENQFLNLLTEVLSASSNAQLDLNEFDVLQVIRFSSVNSEILDILRLCDPEFSGADGKLKIHVPSTGVVYEYGQACLLAAKQRQGVKFLGQLTGVEISCEQIKVVGGAVDLKIRPGRSWRVRMTADRLADFKTMVNEFPHRQILLKGRPELQFGQKSRNVTLFELEEFSLIS